jgi:hypothetical protein
MAPLITVVGTLTAVCLGARLAYQQRRQEDDQDRRSFATALLSEIRFLEGIVRHMRRGRHP